MIATRFCSAHELSEILTRSGVKVSHPTVVNACKRGKLTAMRLKGQWLIVPDERLHKWVEELKVTAEIRARRGRKPKTVVAGERNG
jgi:transposase-like protein